MWVSSIINGLRNSKFRWTSNSCLPPHLQGDWCLFAQPQNHRCLIVTLEILRGNTAIINAKEQGHRSLCICVMDNSCMRDTLWHQSCYHTDAMFFEKLSRLMIHLCIHSFRSYR